MTDLDASGVAPSRPHAPAIDEHRVLGDGRTTALVRPDGEIDWWCAPLPHDDPLLWTLLDPSGGTARFLDAVPRAPARGPVGELIEPIAGPVLTTHLVVDGTAIEVQDALLPVERGGSALVRTVRTVGAAVVVRHALRMGGFGDGGPRADCELARDGLEWRFHADGAPTAPSEHGLVVELELRPDDRPRVMVLTADTRFSVRSDDVLHLVERTARTCRPSPLQSWERRRLTDGLDVLRACTHAPSGALLAAPTTSLPEVPGADRQFDYRYTWLRDGSLGAAVSAVAGDDDVADGYLSFLDGLGPERMLQSPLWTVECAPVPTEREVPGVQGWDDSLPVRVGNAASAQVQYDALGFVVEAISIVARESHQLPPQRWELAATIADRVATHPPGRTAGIWELRDPKPLVAADIGVWMALDHAIRLADRQGLTAPVIWVRAHRAAQRRVRQAVLPDGLLPQAHPGVDPEPPRADASGLLAIICGLIAPDDPVAGHVIDACQRELGTGPFLHRYPPGEDDGFSGHEATFTPASFWMVTALATVGRRAEAEARFAALDAELPRLLSEEWDPTAQRSLGNAPLAWSHIECIRALYALDGSIAA